MNLLEQVISGRKAKPPRITLYGTEGIGKSSFAAAAPKPIFIQTEDGLEEIGPQRFPKAKSFEAVMQALGELYSTKNDFQTVVIDTLDWLEFLVWDDVCQQYGVKSIEKADGGYARGYKHALVQWRAVLDGLDALRNEKGMTVILVAHSDTERVEDPETPAYDRHTPRIHHLAASMICEWSDAVLFASRKFRTQSEDAGFNRTRTIAIGIGKDGGDVVLRTVGGPSCVAKNRYGLPPEMSLDWPSVMEGIAKHQNEGGN